MMRKTLALLALLSTTVAAGAADLPSRRTVLAPIPVPVVTRTWTGFYVGVVGGYDFWNSLGAKPDGFSVGLRAGYDYQLTSNLVLGAMAEGDVNFGRKSTLVGPAESLSFRHTSTASVDARLGYALDGLNLLYVLGGYTGVSVRGTDTLAGVSRSVWSNGNGYNVGAGFEHKFTQNVSAFAEYRYNQVGRSGAGKFSEIKVGLNYRF